MIQHADATREKLKAVSANLQKAIDFHQSNTNDPHNIGTAVLCALLEVKSAIDKAIDAAEGSSHV